ncbi:MAG TPA: amidohydrolase [Bacillota bacterium]|nr:amidohydrolase [Bacillota bacterium]
MFTLLTNGNIRTMDGRCERAEAMVTKDNKFAYVGTESGARNYLKESGEAYEEIDLGGHLVLPAFNDSHMHFIHFAKNIRSVNLSGTTSIREVIERLKAGLERRDPAEKAWLEGDGWNHDYFQDEKRFPNKFDLDEVTDEVPMLVIRTCSHIGVLNSAAMREIGLNKETASQYGDLAEVLPDGEPNGVIKENLLGDVKIKISNLNLETLKEIIPLAQEKLLEQGITSVQSDDIGYLSGSDYELLFKAFQDLEEAGKLRMRLGEQCLLETVPQIKEFFGKGYNVGWGSEKLRVTCIKLLEDGSLGARTAALRKPYADDAAATGLILHPQEELDELVALSHQNGCPVAIHAIGDRAIENALNSIEKVRKNDPKNIRHGIVHCQITDEAQLDRFGKLDVLAFIQPIFIDYDMNIVYDRVGQELAETSYAWKTLIDKGVHASIGSDSPVEAFDSMPNIYSAVARKNITGKEKRVFLPEQKMTMEEAIHAFTVEGAYASGEEAVKGTIAAGKLADFIVLDHDLFNLNNEEEILDTKVLATFFDGELAYGSQHLLKKG